MIRINKNGDTVHYTNNPDTSRDLLASGQMCPVSIDGYPDTNQVIDIPGVPHYISEDELTDYAAYGLTDPGWYVFSTINSGGNGKVTDATTVTGAAGAVAHPGDTHIDIAVLFDVAAVSKTVIVEWDDNYSQTAVFHATDLAIRNLDYRTTFYMYDAEPFCTWSFVLTADETFDAEKFYYTHTADGYELAEVTAGDPVPENTYYNHASLTIEGLARNVSYRLDTPIDCPVTYILPEIEDETHGAWFEVRARYMGTYSSTLQPPDGVIIATEHTQAETKGINMVDLHYTSAGGLKMWRFLNTHSSVPTQATGG